MDDTVGPNDQIEARIRAWMGIIADAKEHDYYFYNRPSEELCGGARVRMGGREMLMFASYSYLGLLGHPKINAAAKEAIDRFGTGTHGVRLLAGTLDLHLQLEQTIAAFKQADDAVTFSSGYVTNLTAVSTLLSRHDVVICDKLNHASIVDGCLLSGAEFMRFRHNDMADLERCLQRANPAATRLVVVDAVFSMDGDIINLPEVARLCRQYGAWLMVDEAHSIGVLGATGHGIEEHFGLPPDTVDIKMGTLSKTIPSVGGYIAGKQDLIDYLRHTARAFIYSAALPPAQAAAARAAFEVIQEEPQRAEVLRRNTAHFMRGLHRLGFDTMRSETAIVPILCGDDAPAFEMMQASQHEDVFALAIVSAISAVPAGQSRLRTTVTAAHTPEDIDQALAVFERAGRKAGVI